MNFLKNFSLLALILAIVSSCTFQDDDDVLPQPPVRNYDITEINLGDVIVTVGGDTVNIMLYSPVSVNSPVLVNNVDNSQIIVHGSQAWAVSHSSTYSLIDQSGQSTPVTVYFGNGAISFNNQVYSPVTVNSPVYVNLDNNTNVIVHGDEIYNVINVDARTFVDLSGQSTVVDVYFAEGAISFNNQVYLENNNDWYYNSDDDIWINIEGDTITQTQMSVYNLSLYQLILNHYAVQDSFPTQGDTLLIPSTDTLITALFDGDSEMLRQNHSGISFQDVMNVGLPLDLNAGTGNFNWFFPADSTVGLFYAVSRVSPILCADDSFMVRLYDMSGVDSATLMVSTQTTTGGRDVCDALSTNGNNIVIAKYFAYRIVDQTAGMQVPANSAFSVRSNVDPSKGVTLKTYINPDPQAHPVTGMFVSKKSNAFKRFDPQQSGLEHDM